MLHSVCPEVITAVGGYPGTGPRVVHPQLFLPLPRSNSPLYKVAVGAPTHTLLPTVSIWNLSIYKKIILLIHLFPGAIKKNT